MLYAHEGIQLTDSPYEFLGAENKPLVKKAVLILLNAKTEEMALYALNRNYPNHKWESILTECKKFHQKISKYFGSGIGIKLQNEDGKMALEIVNRFANQGIAVLPVHDSFIIDKSYSEEMKSTMHSVYADFNNGFDCGVK